MDKPNIFKSSKFYMSEGDILHLIIKDLQGGNISIGLNNANTDVAEDIHEIVQPVPPVPLADLVDKDGNIYTTIIIGAQEWIVENFRCTKYADGTSISYLQKDTLWAADAVGAYCWYNNVIPNGSLYGGLYNWYAATDVRNIAAVGWHVPTAVEYSTLMRYIDIDGTTLANDAGGYLKEIGLTYWNTPNTDATNTYVFNARGGGQRSNLGVFSVLKQYLTLWNSTEDLPNNGYSSYCYNNSAVFQTSYGVDISSADKKYGYSLRLLKDSTTLTHGQTGTYTGNDGKVYRTICIGTQEWLADNLAETKYRDATAIPIVTDNVAWAALVTGAMCYYNNDISYSLNPDTDYGALYNGYAIKNISGFAYLERGGISEFGWRVPTETDFNNLNSFVGGASVAGGMLKEIGLTYWTTPNTSATNTYGMTVLGAGWRETDGTFSNINNYSLFWSDTNDSPSDLWTLYVRYNSKAATLWNAEYLYGLSVRLVRDVT